MTRAFVAIRLPPNVLDAVEARVAGIAMPGARLTTRDQWHVTLQFLGDAADVDAVTGALQRAPLDIVPGVVQLGGAFAFGNPARARILALGLHVGADWLGALAGHVETRLAPLGHLRAPDEDFVPHLTIARHRVPTDLRPACAAIGPAPVGAAWTVDEFVLFESERGAEGARHIARLQLPLGR